MFYNNVTFFPSQDTVDLDMETHEGWGFSYFHYMIFTKVCGQQILHLYVIVEHLIPKPWAFIYWEGCPPDFGTWLQELAPIQPQEH